MPTPLSSVREEAEDSSSDVLGEQTISAAAASSARSHSRIHSRNLSVFFPRPTPNQDDKSTPNAQAPQPHAATGDAGPSDLIPPISARGPDDRTVTRPAQRRGHHHRHSVSLAISPSEIPRVPPILARDGTGTPPQEVGSYASGQGGSLSQQGRPVPPLALVLSIAQIASIYLLFSAIYISKESVELVLLLSDAQGGAGAHVHGHGATAIAGDVAPVGEAVDLGLPVPATALLLGAVASIVLAVVARNHVDLAATAVLLCAAVTFPR
ncbi:hypothetical protein B0A53_01933 [Rhodotorula sp. CCFEE 5036]|nr:hypothetical protein B0A53_01933 [Rhodotorula sp. CCFEE 5036]